ncbi:MAG: sugar ABC transporter permease [Treponema sp.]|nr:sugar ABC transporter permease [Treponema sp.]
MKPGIGKKKTDWMPFLCIAPAFLAMTMVHFLPSLIGIFVSFLNFTSRALRDWTKADFAGFRNYINLFSIDGISGTRFLQSVRASFIYTTGSLVSICVIGLWAATLLNHDGFMYRILRAVFLVSWIIPNVVTVYIWKSIFLSDSGPFNAILVNLKIIGKPIYWLIGPKSIIPPIVSNVWRSWPFAFITFLAGLQSISPDLYDAADVDGASGVQKFFHITLPSLFPITRVLIMLLMVWTALDFTTIYVMYGFAPPSDANVVPVFVYNMGYQTWDFGQAASVSTLLMLFMLGVCIIYVRSFIRNDNNTGVRR